MGVRRRRAVTAWGLGVVVTASVLLPAGVAAGSTGAAAERAGAAAAAPAGVAVADQAGTVVADQAGTVVKPELAAKEATPAAACATTSGAAMPADPEAAAGARASCYRRLPATAAPESVRERATAAKAAAQGVTALDTPPVGWSKTDAGYAPTWCPSGVEAFHRRLRECHQGVIEHIVYVRQTGLVVGSARLYYFEWEELSNKARSWNHDISVNVYEVRDLGSATLMTAQGWCSFHCDATPNPVATYALMREGLWMRGHWPMSALGGDDRDKVYSSANTDFEFINVAVPHDPETVGTDVDFRSRCDSELTSTPREGGCVFDEVTPVLSLDRNAAKYQKHAEFVEQAQDSTPDHYGAQGRGEPLNRLVDEEEIDDNRTESCRGFTKQFPDDSCDEYPYASTYQGAAKIGRDRTAVGHVPETQNEAGGRVLNSFYVANRVLNADKFWVQVTDGPGEGPGVDLPPRVSAGDWVYGNEGAALPVNGSADDEQGPPAVTWSYTPGDVDTGATCTFADPHAASTTITCTDDGAYTLTLTADDGVNEPVSDSTEARISNVAPRFGGRNVPDFAPSAASAAVADGLAPEPWTLFRAGTEVTLTTPYVDPGSNDTQECVVDWDDGTPPQRYSGHGSTCDATHTYQNAGMYSIEVRADDDDAGTDTWRTMIVVYDPDAGGNNSDGSFTSAAGAWAEQPTTAGEEWFHLAARYYPQNPTRPVGNAQTWLANTSFRFDSGSSGVDWLVVTRDGKIASKGTGRLQGRDGEFGYVFYGYDGCANGSSPGCRPGPDRFRTVIWPLSEGSYPTGNAVYDNRAGVDYDVDKADPQPLRSGIVTIHQPV
jgi:hypothetical protein